MYRTFFLHTLFIQTLAINSLHAAAPAKITFESVSLGAGKGYLYIYCDPTTKTRVQHSTLKKTYEIEVFDLAKPFYAFGTDKTERPFNLKNYYQSFAQQYAQQNAQKPA